MKRVLEFLCAAAALYLVLAGTASYADVPGTVEYRGRLANAQGQAFSGTVQIEARLYQQASGGSAVWSETVGSVTVVDGVYAFPFGSAGSGLASWLTGTGDYLAIVVDGVEQSPRTRLLSVPYALKAGRVAESSRYGFMENHRKIEAPENLWFGNVATNQSVMAHLKIRNTGFGTVQISSIEYPDGFSGGNYSGVLPAGGEVEVDVSFEPDEGRLFRGAIRIFSNVGGVPLEVIATGKGYGITARQGMVTVPSGSLTTASPAGSGQRLAPIFVSGNRTHDRCIRYVSNSQGGYYYNACAVLPGRSTYGGGSNSNSVRSFMIGRHEVTWDEWRAVQLYGSSRGYDLGTMRLNIGTHPVDSVNWYDAVKYCNALSEMEGLRPVYLNPTTSTVYRSGENLPVIDERANGYRLPTSAEWEMAARGGPGSPVYDYSGSNILSQVGRYIANSTGAPFDMYYGGGQGTWPVGGLLPNALGIYDMSGNVREWCWDTDPGVGFGMQATVRGGSWLDSATNCRVDWRGNTSASTRYLLYGFRVASEVDPVEEPPDGMTLVTGGTLPAQSALGAVAVPGFYLSHFELTWEEFRSVFTFAGVLGYDNPSTWFDSNEGVQEGDRPFSNDWTTAAIKWCNLLSEVEGLTPVYRRVSTGGVIRHGSLNFQDVRAETGADGYRLPTEAEWEWAARGGLASQGFAYSGSNALDGVGWYAGNSGGNEIHLRIGRKLPNELQLFDMSGGVWEMCWAGDGNDPVLRGGDRTSPAADCAVGTRNRTGIGPMAIGFRLARTISN